MRVCEKYPCTLCTATKSKEEAQKTATNYGKKIAKAAHNRFLAEASKDFLKTHKLMAKAGSSSKLFGPIVAVIVGHAEAIRLAAEGDGANAASAGAGMFGGLAGGAIGAALVEAGCCAALGPVGLLVFGAFCSVAGATAASCATHKVITSMEKK